MGFFCLHEKVQAHTLNFFIAWHHKNYHHLLTSKRLQLDWPIRSIKSESSYLIMYIYISMNYHDPKSSNLVWKFNYFERRHDGFQNNYKDFRKWRRYRVKRQRKLLHVPQVWMHHSSAHAHAGYGRSNQARLGLCVPFAQDGPWLYGRCFDEGICCHFPWTFPVWDGWTSCDYPSSTIKVTDYFAMNSSCFLLNKYHISYLYLWFQGIGRWEGDAGKGLGEVSILAFHTFCHFH